LLELAKQGHYVIGTATSESGAEKITEVINQAGFKGEGRILNVASAESITALCESLKANPGMPSILVNNAGITRDNLMMRMSDTEWDEVINTNLSGVFRLTKACLRSMMQARWGRIISIGSVVGSMGNAGQANYCAAKAGVIGFSKSLAREIGSRNVTVNVVAPGFIETDMTAVLPETQKAALIEAIALKRIGKPEDIAAAVGFLASDSAGYITGETLHINGGMHMV
jgi:3-oxoacyl-[acyl-carrier protein] reductase